MGEKIDWSKVRSGRDRASRIHGKCGALPRVDSSADLLLKLIADGAEVLDVGANDRNVEKLFRAAKRSIDYRSFDVDQTHAHDWNDLAEVTGSYDFVLVLEVIEHLPPADVAQMLQRLRAMLKPGGTVVVSTPNVCHPTRFWRDCTHITPFRYDELAGFLYSSDFAEVQLYRIKKMRAKDWLRYWLALPVLRLLDIDFAPGIVAVAKAGEPSAGGKVAV